jgi:hypothetical protein
MVASRQRGLRQASAQRRAIGARREAWAVVGAGARAGRRQSHFGARERRHDLRQLRPPLDQDFTATLLKRNERAFTAAGLDLKKLSGRNIRLRGVIEERGGPWIELTSPEQVEVLGGRLRRHMVPDSGRPGQNKPKQASIAVKQRPIAAW